MERTKLQLPRSKPEAQGIPSTAVIDFLNAIKGRQLELHSFMLLRHGNVVAEGWWNPFSATSPHMLFSLSKSFTSTAIGFAASEGILKLDDTVISFFPADVPEEIETNLAAMQIRHLLMMGTGHDKDTTDSLFNNKEGNWAKTFFEHSVEHEPGTHFVYNSGATYMLAAILHKVTGQTLLEYLQPRLFDPLDIIGATWETNVDGIQVGGWGLNVTTEDIAKFGQLYLQKGMWNGQRLLSEEWIEEASSKQISNGDGGDSDWSQGYGYQFWRCRHDMFRGDGAFGQFCIVMPEQDAVLAMTSGTNDLQGVMNAVIDHLLPAMETSTQALNLESQAMLESELLGLAIHLPQVQSSSPLEAKVSGKSFELDNNPLNLKKISITFETEHTNIFLSKEKEQFQFPLGREQWVEGETCFLDDTEKRIFSSFTWLQNDTLQVTQLLIETPFSNTMQIKFEGDTITLSNKSNVLNDHHFEIKGKSI